MISSVSKIYGSNSYRQNKQESKKKKERKKEDSFKQVMQDIYVKNGEDKK